MDIQVFSTGKNRAGKGRGNTRIPPSSKATQKGLPKAAGGPGAATRHGRGRGEIAGSPSMVDEPRRRNLNLGPGAAVLKSEPLRIRGRIQTRELPISGISCGYRGIGSPVCALALM